MAKEGEIRNLNWVCSVKPDRRRHRDKQHVIYRHSSLRCDAQADYGGQELSNFALYKRRQSKARIAEKIGMKSRVEWLRYARTKGRLTVE